MPVTRQILATSGGFQPTGRDVFSWRRGPIIDYALRITGKQRPRICYLGTGAGDRPAALAAFYGAFAGADDVRPSHLQLFTMPNVDDVSGHLLDQDVIWVGGGSTVNLLACWRAHGIDQVMREAWERGVVLGGVSAGSICWHVGGPTDSFGPQLQVIDDALAFLPFGNGVHYDGEAQRRPLLHRAVAEGALPTSYATDDGVGLHYQGSELAEVVSDRPDAAAYVVRRGKHGEAEEVELAATLLG